MGIFTKNINKGAYQGKLTCPVCHSEAIRWVEDLTAYRQRYRCRKCGITFQYDISNLPMGAEGSIHPYGPFKKEKWLRIVELYELGSKLKVKQGGMK